jgi:hypothetical protein
VASGRIRVIQPAHPDPPQPGVTWIEQGAHDPPPGEAGAGEPDFRFAPQT